MIRCRSELALIRSAGRSTSVAGALSWSLAAIVWGNGVVAAGRRFGHDQWFTLLGLPLFGVAGWWWLQHRGFTRQAIGLRLPHADQAPVLTGLTSAAAIFVAVSAVAGLAAGGTDMRGLRTIRTVVGTAFGEELIHRGVLVTVWASTGSSTRTVVTANVAVFGLWHWVGATCGAVHLEEVVAPAALAVPLVWLRLRLRSIFAPMAFHAAVNLGGVFH